MKKVSFGNEKKRIGEREKKAQLEDWISQNRNKLSAIQEGKRVSVYFQTDSDIAEFVHAVNWFKDIE